MICPWLPQGREVAARAVRLALPCFTPLHLKGVTLGGSLPCLLTITLTPGCPCPVMTQPCPQDTLALGETGSRNS